MKIICLILSSLTVIAASFSFPTSLKVVPFVAKDNSSQLRAFDELNTSHFGPSDDRIIGKLVFLLPNNAAEVKSRFGSNSPYGNPSVLEAAEQLQRKAHWFSEGVVDAKVIILPQEQGGFDGIRDAVFHADALIAFNLSRDVDLMFLRDVFDERSKSGRTNICHYAIDCEGKFPPICASYNPDSPSLSSNLIPWSIDATSKRMEEQMMRLFERQTSDDFTIALMLFFNQFSGKKIDWVKHSIDATWEKGAIQNAKEFIDMFTKCGDCVAKCIADEKCKECLSALTAIDTRDQVSSYRTIVSYESELLRDFSLCILQKNNIFNCDAKIPESPKVQPLKTFRGEALTAETARRILVGHLDDEISLPGSQRGEISWKVAAGANVAYDQFPSQNQIFYETANRRDMWYDPVFRVETIDGRNIWCKRHYRVRDGPVPGTFFFSVLDNVSDIIYIYMFLSNQLHLNISLNLNLR